MFEKSRKLQDDLDYPMVAFFFYAPMIVYLIQIFVDSQLILYVKMIIYLIPNIYMIIYSFRRKKVYIIGIVLIYISLLSISIWKTPEIRLLYYDSQLTIFSRCICGFYFGKECKNYNLLIKSFKKGYFIIVVCLILIVLKKSTIDKSDAYLTLSIIFQIPILMMFCYSFINKRKILLLSSIIIIGFIVIQGSRGGSLALISSIVLIFIIYNHIFNKNYKILISLYILLIVCVIYQFEEIRRIIWEIFSTLFPQSRNVELILSNEILNDSGRNIYYEHLMQLIRENPFEFRGIFSDRVEMSNYIYGRIIDSADGCYAHNIILEILYGFGILFGGLIITISIIMIIRALYFSSKKKEINIICINCICLGNIMWLLFSNSYLINTVFWFSIGNFINLNSKIYVRNNNLNMINSKGNS